jgi:Ca2+-binding EF-hand superfamily protein
MERWIRSVLALVMAVALVAQAQNPKGGKQRGGGGGGKGLMEQADTNGDGKIDQAEAEQFAATRAERVKSQLDTIVKKFDANGDGALDADEVAKMKNEIADRGGPDPTKLLKQFDTNGDFQISDEEEQAAIKRFAQHVQQAGGQGGGPAGGQRGPGAQQARGERPNPDTNGDCIVDEEEAKAEAERRVEMIKKQLEGFEKRKENNPEANLPGFLAMLDKDGNGQISDEELNAVSEETMKEFQQRNELVLKIYDEDGNGTLDEAELAAAKKGVLFSDELQRLNAERFRRNRGEGDAGARQKGNRAPREGKGAERPKRRNNAE